MRHYPGIRTHLVRFAKRKRRKLRLPTPHARDRLLREHRLLEANGALFDPQIPQTPEEAVLAAERTRLISRLIETLKPREQRVLELRYGDREMTLDAIATAFGVTRERIRQLEAKAFRKLLHPTRMGHHLLGWLHDDVRTRHTLPADRFYVPQWKIEEEAAYDAVWDEAHALNDSFDARHGDLQLAESDEQYYRDWCARHDAEAERRKPLLEARARYIAELFTANEPRRYAEYVAELYATLGPRPMKVHYAKTE